MLNAMDKTSKRMTHSGAVVGFSAGHNTHAWLGIPFAEPPVGALRWCAPRPVAAWGGDKPALAFGQRSRQKMLGSIFGDKQYLGSEDCLFLNLWSPKFSPDRIPLGSNRLPVMVWVHGGGNIFGGGDMVDGAALADSQQVILVSFNYRLSTLGWFLSPFLHDGTSSREDKSGNFGTLDMIAVLRWVAINISAFGGDPDRVTIFGSSAGGSNVRSLLASPLAEGLFHRAIVQSCSLYLSSLAEAENFIDADIAGHPQSSGELILRLLQDDGIAKGRAEARRVLLGMDSRQVASYLRGKDLEEFESAYLKIASLCGDTYWPSERENMIKVGAAGAIFAVPKLFSDGFVIGRGNFDEIFSEGRFNRVPTIMGSCKDEDKTFLALDPTFVSRDATSGVVIKDVAHYELVAGYLSKFWQATGVDEFALSMKSRGEEALFCYRLDWDEQGVINGVDVSLLNGADHGNEGKFLFGGEVFLRGPEHPPERRVIHEGNESGFLHLSQAMMSYWSQFAYTGDPGRGRDGSLPLWSCWNGVSGGDTTLIFDTAAEGGIRMSKIFLDRAMLVEAMENDGRLADRSVRRRFYEDIFRYFITRLSFRKFCQLRDAE